MVQILPFIDLLSCANPQIEVVWFDVLMPMLTALADLRDGQIPLKTYIAHWLGSIITTSNNVEGNTNKTK
jgi:hypothetical protein